MFRTGFLAGIVLFWGCAVAAEGMQTEVAIPQVVIEETAGGFTSGLVIVLVMLGLIGLMGSGDGGGGAPDPDQ